MIDEDVIAVSPATTYRVLKKARLFSRWNNRVSSKGRGFKQPLEPHEHWHTDVSYININVKQKCGVQKKFFCCLYVKPFPM